MKIASIRTRQGIAWGWVDGDEIVLPGEELQRSCPDISDLLATGAPYDLQDAGERDRIALADARFAPVIPRPDKIICVGINFRAHMREMGREPPEYPWLFTRFADSLVGHRERLVRPRESSDYDFEGEFAVIIGREAHHVQAADALDYVAGYSCFMDGSVRDFQRHGSQFTPGKNFYRSGSFGPWLVTADEIPDPAAAHLQTRLNGEVMQDAPIADLKFGIPELIEYCTRFCKLRPGDVISTGTPGGVGFARKPPVWLKPGDRLEVEVDLVGVLANTVEDEPAG